MEHVKSETKLSLLVIAVLSLIVTFGLMVSASCTSTGPGQPPTIDPLAVRLLTLSVEYYNGLISEEGLTAEMVDLLSEIGGVRLPPETKQIVVNLLTIVRPFVEVRAPEWLRTLDKILNEFTMSNLLYVQSLRAE